LRVRVVDYVYLIFYDNFCIFSNFFSVRVVALVKTVISTALFVFLLDGLQGAGLVLVLKRVSQAGMVNQI
jgi:hypothetical protein